MMNKNMKHADVKALLAKRQLQKVLIDVPEWEMSIYIRQLTASKSLELQKIGADTNENILEAIICLLEYSIVDEDNKPVFNKAELKQLSESDTMVIFNITEAVNSLNGNTQKKQDESKQDFLQTP